jgi:hypothetical protein
MHANEEIKWDEYNIKHSLPVNRHVLKDIVKPLRQNRYLLSTRGTVIFKGT